MPRNDDVHASRRDRLAALKSSRRLEPEVISTNLVFTTPNPDTLHFAVLSSSMFMAWQKVIGGRLESRI